MSSQLTLKDVSYLVAQEFWNKWHNTAKQPSELERHVWQLSAHYEIRHLGSIEDIADSTFKDVNARITKKLVLEQIHQEEVTQRQIKRIKSIKQKLLHKARTHKDKREPDKISNLKIIKNTPPGLPPLTPEQIAELYKYYSDAWDASQKQMSQEERIDKTKEELLRKARTDTNRQSSKQISNLKIIKDTPPGLPPLTTEQIAELYDYYKENRDVLRVPVARPKRQRDKDLKTRINEFVQTHRDEILSLDEFKQIIKDWNRNMTINEAYILSKQVLQSSRSCHFN